jgi:hypothetical protein
MLHSRDRRLAALFIWLSHILEFGIQEPEFWILAPDSFMSSLRSTHLKTAVKGQINSSNVQIMKLKYRKIGFSLLLALFAGISIADYSASEADFVFKTIELLVIQQVGGAIFYLICFAPDLMRSPPSSKE